jgi:DNA-binding CsgD family transcriptional regulator
MPQDLDKALDALFEAAIGYRDWGSVLSDLSASFGAAGASIISPNAQEFPLAPISGELPDVMAAFVAQGWYRDDLRGQRAWPLALNGQSVVVEHHLSTDHERATLPYYQEFFVPMGLPWFASVAAEVEGKKWALTLLRGAGQGAFVENHLPELARIERPLGNAIKLAARIHRAQMEGQQQATRMQGSALLTLNGLGEVVGGRDTAAPILSPDLAILGRHLQATSREHDARLQSLLAKALLERSEHEAPLGMVLGGAGGSRLLLEIVAAPDRSIFFDAALWIILRRIDPEQAILRAEKVQRLLGLTPSEARVAVRIASGYSPREAASHLGSSYQTVRTQLASIFRKLGISRQSELSLLLAHLVA